MLDLASVMFEIGNIPARNIVSPLEQEAIDSIGPCQRWNVFHGERKLGLGLSKEHIVRFIPESIRNDFKSFQDRTIRVIDFNGSSDEIKKYQFLFEQSFQNADLESVITLNDSDECQAFIVGADSKAVNSESLIKVHDDEVKRNGKVMILTNRSECSIAPVSKTKYVKFNGRSGRDFWLRESESALFKLGFENGHKVWEEIGRSEKYEVTFDANPLVRQSGPVFLYNDNGEVKTLNHPVDGELFIPIHIIEELLKSKIGPSKPPFFEWLCSRSQDDISIFFELAKQRVEEKKVAMLMCLVYEHLPDHHTVVTTLYLQEDKLSCYIHETIGFEHELAKEIRYKLAENIKSSFDDRPIIFSTLKEPIQKDLSTCGVFAIKKVLHVSKNPEWWCSFLNNLRAPKSSMPEADIVRVSVKNLHPAMLKLCQYTKLPLPGQKKTVIGHKKCWDLTLEQYWQAYDYKPALVKLCKYYSDYAALKEKSDKREVKVSEEQACDSMLLGKHKLRSCKHGLYQPSSKKEKVQDGLTGKMVYLVTC